MEARKYERNRTSALAIRLTNEEKSMLKTRAADSGKSMTDFIMSAALDYSGASVWKPIIKRLDEVRDELQKLARFGKSDDLCDALEALREVYGLVLGAIKKE